MGNRAKKDASSALKDLANYIRRDTSGTKMLADVQRYVGELRQQSSGLKKDLEQTEESRSLLAVKLDALESQVESMTAELDRNKSVINQLRKDLKKANASISELELEDKEEPEPESARPYEMASLTTLRVSRLFKSVKKVMPYSIEPAMLEPNELCQTFELRDIVVKFEAEEYTLLGRFVALSVLMGFDCTFTTGFPTYKGLRGKSLIQDKLLARFIHWMKTCIKSDGLHHAKVWDWVNLGQSHLRYK